ncbi:MAG: acetolactate synthase small subunit [Oscillospiraceae bacterium]|jgi:acetolactate synthase-1/3 small subunit
MSKNTLSILVENEAGVLSQVTRLFARKGYNIDSLAVGTTDNPRISRITVVVEGDDYSVRQITNQVKKLLSVISVRIISPENMVSRELALVKVKADTKDTRDEIIQIVNVFRAKTVDMSKDSLTIESTGNEDKINAIIGLLSDFGIIEICRTGIVALERGRTNMNESTKEREEYDYGKNVL